MAEIFGKILGIFFALLFTYLADFLMKRIKNEELKKLIKTFVSSAEQVYKAQEHSGPLKKEYVVSELLKLGYELTDYINALIESAVYELK